MPIKYVAEVENNTLNAIVGGGMVQKESVPLKPIRPKEIPTTSLIRLVGTRSIYSIFVGLLYAYKLQICIYTYTEWGKFRNNVVCVCYIDIPVYVIQALICR